ncbi:MAG TPA: T9SS type A sorting domain-containing protein, partial [Saprospiraceae bacterium]|nr:T9SS type A sorting domain-containing protein [Saprospiraceae bacterium]
IDCGGPNCPPCPTCSDGIKNGQETGIDCGGPNCPPCKIENGSETTLIGGYYFESGWDDWESSGSNSTRLKTAYSPEGSYSIQIKGNSSSSASMTSLLYDLSKYDTIAIEFRVRATGNNTGDGFSFRYFNGKSWITVQQYIFRQDYTNSLIYSKKIKLKGPLSKESQFRIQMNRENKGSHIYIDAVTIHGITSKSKTSCEDGIQNGLETGIDCGGPSCPPCNPDDVQDEVSLGGFFFETGWDGWNSGGAFSKRLKTAYSPEGSYSIQLKGNHNDASSMISPEFNSGSFDTVAIEFRLRSIHAKPGDKLIVKYFNGTSWIIVQEYLYPSDFSNSLKYTKNLILTGSLSNHSKLAIETQLYDEDSQIYVDAITITGHKKQLPTCTDGIHNGLETGIDCGGPSCSPCAGDEDDQEVMLAGYFFETGWDKWIGETQGTIRHTGVPSPEGSHCIHMNHPFGQSTFMTSEEFNLYPYKSLTVTFDFITQNMQDGERFMLQYYNGGRWITLNTFISGLDFVNDIPYNTTYHLNGILSTHAVFRIYKDVSAIQSTLYIDAVILKARNKESLTESPLEIRINGEKLRNEVSPDILIIPNPASDYISFITDEHIKSVKIYSTSGKLAFHIENEISNSLDISDLVSGMYIVVIETAQNIYNKKLIKR